MSRGSSAFTLVEALAATVLLGIGIAATMGGLGAMARTERLRAERMLAHDLAQIQLNEVIATDPLDSPLIEGDFADEGYESFAWSLDVTPTGTEGLDLVRISVTRDGVDEPAAVLETLRYRPAEVEEAAP